MCIDFTSMYSSTLSRPHSQPLPERMKPPHGLLGTTDDRCIDPRSPGSDLAHRRNGLVDVLGPDTGGKAVLGIVGKGNRFVHRVEWNDRQQRRAVQSGDLTVAREINDAIYPLVQAFYADPILDMHNRMKECLAMLGLLPHAVVRPPLAALSDEERANLRRALRESKTFGDQMN
ncbi:MAG: hypothetical protein GY798_27275 [Hyphomicrobiales bacterium]|nr:hypothetical protein [Hyphomicrobiales bacterium]